MNDEERKARNREYNRIWRNKNRARYRKQQAEYRERHREEIRARHKEWVDNNKEANDTHKKKWSDNNRDAINTRSREYWNNHRGEKAAHCAKRRAAKLERTPPWANMKKIERIYMLANWASKFTDEPLEVDHIIPLQGKNISGLHVHTNLQILKRSENQAKSNNWSE